MPGASPSFVHYVPIVTTLLSIPFAIEILRRWSGHRDRLHLLWWGVGIALYGAGTFTESWTTLFGWSEPVFKSWYVFGALLGGAPLAQGTTYFLASRWVAHALSILLLTTVVVASVAVTLSPIRHELVETHRLTGRVFEWTWVRRFSPFINTYAAIVLIGGALWSAQKYRRVAGAAHRVAANVWIAVGGLLPGIGGAATRFGYTEVLYVAELLGLLCIWRGYRMSVRSSGEG